MYSFLLILLTLDALILTTAVLLQAGQGGGLASLGGGAGTEQFMGGRQATTLLTKITWWCAGIFLFVSLVLAVISAHSAAPRSVLEGGAPARRGRRRARAVRPAVELAGHGRPGGLARRRARPPRRRRRHPPAHAPHPLQGCDARRRGGGRAADRRRAYGARREPVDGRSRSRHAGDHRRRVHRRARRRAPPHRGVRLRDEAQHPAVVSQERLPRHRDPGGHAGRAGARAGTRRSIPLQRAGRSGRGVLRHHHAARSRRWLTADLRHLPRPPTARFGTRRGDGKAPVRASGGEPSGAGSCDRTSTYHLTKPWLRGPGRY